MLNLAPRNAPMSCTDGTGRPTKSTPIRRGTQGVLLHTMRLPKWRVTRALSNPSPWFAFLITCTLCLMHWVLSHVWPSPSPRTRALPDLRLPPSLMNSTSPDSPPRRKPKSLSPSSTIVLLHNPTRAMPLQKQAQALVTHVSLPKQEPGLSQKIIYGVAALRARKAYPFIAISKRL